MALPSVGSCTGHHCNCYSEAVSQFAPYAYRSERPFVMALNQRMKSSVSDFEAIGLALAGFTLWVLADSTIKLIGKSALPAYEIIAFLGLSVIICLAAYAFVRGQTQLLWPRDPRRQAVRSCLDLANNLCVVIALRHVPLTMFYILIFTAPMLITLLAAIFLKEKIELRKGLAIVAGFAGVVIAVNPLGSSRPGDWTGYAACAVCVTCFSINMVWSRVLTRTETPESLTFFSGVVMIVAGSSAMLWHAQPLTPRLLAGLFATGAFCALGGICFFIALKHTSAANVSQYHYTQLITGALVAYFVWHELPSTSLVMGGLAHRCIRALHRLRGDACSCRRPATRSLNTGGGLIELRAAAQIGKGPSPCAERLDILIARRFDGTILYFCTSSTASPCAGTTMVAWPALNVTASAGAMAPAFLSFAI
jgi:drug/metabolite transporter (DMT)-like permease